VSAFFLFFFGGCADGGDGGATEDGSTGSEALPAFLGFVLLSSGVHPIGPTVGRIFFLAAFFPVEAVPTASLAIPSIVVVVVVVVVG
jgi:hypothetical protein